MNNCILITGGAKRIGRGLVENFAAKGWDIILHYHKSEAEAKQLRNKLQGGKGRVMAVAADLRDNGNVKSMFDKIGESGMRPNVLVNNAAVFPKPINFKDLSVDDWDNTISTNLSSVFRVSKCFTDMATDMATEGRIINFASLGAHEVWSGRAAYHAAKSGVLHLTRAMAKDLAPDYSVNSVSPGVVDIPEDPNDDKSISFESRIPMKRFGKTDDIFDAVWFFATCSKYITGQDIKVDGGWHYSR